MTKLIVYSHKLFRKTRHGFQTDGAFTVQMDALAAHFDELILCVPVIEESNFLGIGFQAENIRFRPLPFFQGRWGFLRKIPVLSREILVGMKTSDLALVILPSYLAILASFLCQCFRFPVFQWVVGDWTRNVISRRQGNNAWITTMLSPFMDFIIARLTRDVLTFFNGRILYNHYQSHHHTRISSSILSQDIYSGLDNERRLTPPYHLLYVGRLSLEKGITYLLQAVAANAEAGIFHLDIVGEGSLYSALVFEVHELGIDELVTFHGYVPQGKHLRHLFRQSDVFVLPALQDQQPKVLLEAMSQSLPIVATRVGGIPSIISDGNNGLLVPPAKPEALITAIQQLLTRKERESIILGGLAYVRERTVEAETLKMVGIVRDYFKQKIRF
jgi:glycosyltransferase involved in cell wall biosynthesis